MAGKFSHIDFVKQSPKTDAAALESGPGNPIVLRLGGSLASMALTSDGGGVGAGGGSSVQGTRLPGDDAEPQHIEFPWHAFARCDSAKCRDAYDRRGPCFFMTRCVRAPAVVCLSGHEVVWCRCSKSEAVLADEALGEI